jgi:Uma2 family endonuclease
MPDIQTLPETHRTVADLVDSLGGIPLNRIRISSPLRPATVQDVERIAAREGVLCELIDGVLVEKAMGLLESFLASFLIIKLNEWVRPRNLGLVSAPDGTVELTTGLVRIPDVAFFSWDRLPDRRIPAEPIPQCRPESRRRGVEPE